MSSCRSYMHKTNRFMRIMTIFMRILYPFMRIIDWKRYRIGRKMIWMSTWLISDDGMIGAGWRLGWWLMAMEWISSHDTIYECNFLKIAFTFHHFLCFCLILRALRTCSEPFAFTLLSLFRHFGFTSEWMVNLLLYKSCTESWWRQSESKVTK